VSESVTGLVTDLVGSAARSVVLEEVPDDQLDLGAVIDACRTPPFLADRRVIVLRDVGRFNLDQVQPLVAYLEAPMPTTRLIVAAGGGQCPAKLVNAFKKSAAAAVVTTDVSTREVHGWFSDRLAHAPVKLAPQAAAMVEAHLGEDLNRLSALLAVLETAYGRGARIGPDELSPYLGQAGAVPPWDLTDAIDRGENEQALQVLHRLTGAGGRHPLVVLAILQRHYGNVLRVQSPAIAAEAQAAEVLGIAKGRSTFPARKTLDAARRLGPAGTGDAVIALADAELALKGKVDWRPELVLEVLIARLCQISRKSRGSPSRAAPRKVGSQRR
jgi:DNA polymerase-3 subunit delta